MAISKGSTRPFTLSRSRTTLLAIDHLIEHLKEPTMISAIGKTVGQISDLGITEKIDTIDITSEILGNPKMARLIKSLTNNQDEVDIAAAIAEIIISASWKCLCDANLSSDLAAFVSMARQINAIPEIR